MEELAKLYETDYGAWAKRMAELLRERRFDELDLDHLIEELEDMSRSERRELHSRLIALLAHLLKWAYQYPLLEERWREFDGRSWRLTIIEQREQIAELLSLAPSLKSVLHEAIAQAYPPAVRLAHKETRLPLATFPKTCPYTPEQVLDDEFYPQPVKTPPDM